MKELISRRQSRAGASVPVLAVRYVSRSSPALQQAYTGKPSGLRRGVREARISRLRGPDREFRQSISAAVRDADAGLDSSLGSHNGAAVPMVDPLLAYRVGKFILCGATVHHEGRNDS